MRKLVPTALAFAAALTLGSARSAVAQTSTKEPPPAPFKKVSSLVPLPSFLPGMGTLYVDPATLPAGPFYGYNRAGRLVNTIYMIPLDSLNAHHDFNGLNVAQQKVDHVDMYFNAGHAGVATPHYHIVLWYVSRAAAAAVK